MIAFGQIIYGEFPQNNVMLCPPPQFVLITVSWLFLFPFIAVGRGIFCDNLDVIDFYLSELCPVVYINECELVSKVLYERKLKKIHKVCLDLVCVCACTCMCTSVSSIIIFHSSYNFFLSPENILNNQI